MKTASNNTPNGWVKLFFRFKDWEWYGDPNMVALFVHLLLSANFKPLRWRGIEIPRGSLVTSLDALATETGLTVRSVRTALKRLETTKEITNHSTNNYRIITLCKYDEYQAENIEADKADDKQNDKQATSDRQSADKQTTTSIEYKKERIYIVVSSPRACAREEFLADFFKEERSQILEALCMNMSTDLETLKRIAKEVVDDWQATSTPAHHDLTDAQRHLLSQMRIKLYAERRQADKQTARKQPTQSRAKTAQNKAPRNVSDRWDGFKTPTE